MPDSNTSSIPPQEEGTRSFDNTFASQINRAQHLAMSTDPKMMCFGLGIDDPKTIFGTTDGLQERYGKSRVFDTPTSENAMTGIAIGSAIAGSRVLVTHQRVDFFLLAMDQLVNNAAKWHYMFNGQMRVPLTIRLIVGRGWGQGPTHQQSLQSWFAHIPGLKVVTPSLTKDVAPLLYQAIMDDNPVVFIEHRWLHNQECEHEQIANIHECLTPSQFRSVGEDLTIISSSYMVLEALRAQVELSKHNVRCDIIDLTQITETDWQVIYDSVNKTGRCVIVDPGHMSFGIGAEISARITENCFKRLKAAPVRLGLPDYPEPTSFGLTRNYYNNLNDIVSSALELLGKPAVQPVGSEHPHDVPGQWFKGPF